jgi:Flp pilus assembly pilin Flp
MKKKLWSDCRGAVITTELLLVSSVVVAALLTGLSAFKNSVTGEFRELGHSIQEADKVDQPSHDHISTMIEASDAKTVDDIFVPEGFGSPSQRN